jgi:hypothetical protein
VLSFADIAALHQADPDAHRRAAESRGLVCPPDVFEQLFHEPHADLIFAALLRPIDWQTVRWRETELSGAAIAGVHIPRDYEHAVEEARSAVVAEGLMDDRSDVVEHWAMHQSWFRSPILLTGDVVARPVAYELVVGFTRVGNLLGLMDREDIAPFRGRRQKVAKSSGFSRTRV